MLEMVYFSWLQTPDSGSHGLNDITEWLIGLRQDRVAARIGDLAD